MEAWRKLWHTEERVIAYLATITDPERRKTVAASIGATSLLSQVASAPSVPVQEPPRAPSRPAPGKLTKDEALKRIRKAVEGTIDLPPTLVETFQSSPPRTWLFELPWGPSVNHYWRSLLIPWRSAPPGQPPYRVQPTISKEGRHFRATVIEAVKTLKRAGLHVALPPGARLAIEIKLHAPNHRSYDIDNRVKAVLDGLTHAEVYVDDSLVDLLTIRRCAVRPGQGRMFISITTTENTLFEE